MVRVKGRKEEGQIEGRRRGTDRRMEKEKAR